MRADETQRVGGVAGLGHDLEPLLAVEQHAQPATHDDVVVGEDDRDLGAPVGVVHGRGR